MGDLPVNRRPWSMCLMGVALGKHIRCQRAAGRAVWLNYQTVSMSKARMALSLVASGSRSIALCAASIRSNGSPWA